MTYQQKWTEKNRVRIRAYKKKYRKAHPEWVSNQRSRFARKTRARLIKFLGGKCRGCGLDDTDVLVFDHKNNDGRLDKRRMHNTTIVKYYLDHIREAKRKLMLLCHNCNWRKEMILRELKRLQGIGIPPILGDVTS